VLLGDGIRYLALVNAASAWSGGTRRWRASRRMSWRPCTGAGRVRWAARPAACRVLARRRQTP